MDEHFTAPWKTETGIPYLFAEQTQTNTTFYQCKALDVSSLE